MFFQDGNEYHVYYSISNYNVVDLSAQDFTKTSASQLELKHMLTLFK